MTPRDIDSVADPEPRRSPDAGPFKSSPPGLGLVHWIAMLLLVPFLVVYARPFIGLVRDGFFVESHYTAHSLLEGFPPQIYPRVLALGCSATLCLLLWRAAKA